MKLNNCVLRLLYFADRHKIDRKSRLHALVYRAKEGGGLDCSFEKERDGVGTELFSEDIVEAVVELESMDLLSVQEKLTYGDKSVYSYYLTEKGIERADNLVQETDEDKYIRNVYEKYGEVPVSNLLRDIVEDEAAHEWSK